MNRKLGIIVVALMIACGEVGCTGAQAAAGVEMGCDIVRKICTVAGGACALAPVVVENTSGGETEDESGDAVEGVAIASP